MDSQQPPESQTPAETDNNSNQQTDPREHVYKTQDGAQKNIQLPIEAIQESLNEHIDEKSPRAQNEQSQNMSVDRGPSAVENPPQSTLNNSVSKASILSTTPVENQQISSLMKSSSQKSGVKQSPRQISNASPPPKRNTARLPQAPPRQRKSGTQGIVSSRRPNFGNDPSPPRQAKKAPVLPLKSQVTKKPSATAVELTEEQVMEEVIAEMATMDPHERFEAMKAKFFLEETDLGGEEYVKEQEEKKKQQEQAQADLLPSRAQLEKSIKELMRREEARNDKIQAIKQERRKKKEELKKAGNKSDHSSLKTDSEEIDFAVQMQEEQVVPEGQEQFIEDEYEGTGITKRVIRTQHQPKLMKTKFDSGLPKRLPDCLVYWNRLATRVESNKLVSLKQLTHFQNMSIIQFENPEANKQTIDEFPYFKNANKWQDPSRQRYSNRAEEAIFKSREWPVGMKKYEIEGFIKFERIRGTDVVFNSRFESGNLRQAFRVPYNHDFESVEVEEEVPDFLPEIDQQEIRERILERRKKLVQEKQERLQKEEEDAAAAYKLKMEKIAAKKAEQAHDSGNDTDKSNKKINEEEEEVERKKKKARGTKQDMPKGIDTEYNLYLQDDTNADSATFQWYYFSVMNIYAETTVRFNICNLSKPNGLYSKGMKPFVYSVNKAKTTGEGWHRGGKHVRYYANGNAQRYTKKTLDAHWLTDGSVPVGNDQFKKLHTLQFDYKFESEYDIVFFAHFQPYTYTDMINFLSQLECKNELKDRFRMDYICDSLSKVPVYGLTITNDIQNEYVSQYKEIFKWKKFEYGNQKIKPKKIKFLNGEPPIKGEEAKPSEQKAVKNAKPKDENQPDDGADAKSAKTSQRGEERKQDSKLSGDTKSPQKEQEAKQEQDTKADDNKTKNEAEQPADGKKQDEGQKPTDGEKPADSEKPADGEKKEDVTESKKEGENEKKDDDGKSAEGQKTPQEKKDDEETKVSPREKEKKKEDKPPDPENEKKYKKHIFITARVHPGETQASHMVHGMINFLLSDDPEAQEMRDKFVIKVVPMLNVDGVINGNYRVSVLGVDLNRRWKKPSKFLHPEIYYTKSIIKYFNGKSKVPGCDSGGVVMCVDLHGHSRNMDLFMYSCIEHDLITNLIIRACPTAVDRQVPIFNFGSCKFAIEKDKENTARVVLFKEFGILSAYTLEATFYGSEFLKRNKAGYGQLIPREVTAAQNERYQIRADRKDISINEEHLLLVGEDFVRGINYAAKRRPLLNYWFRCPPRNLIEVDNKYDPWNDPDVDPRLLALEQAWKPTGKVHDDKFTGLGEKFGGDRMGIYDGQDGDENDQEAKKIKKKKKDQLEAEEAEKQKKKVSKKKEKKPELNLDLAEVKQKTKTKGKKKKKKGQGAGLGGKNQKHERSMDSLESAVDSVDSPEIKTKKKASSLKKKSEQQSAQQQDLAELQNSLSQQRLQQSSSTQSQKKIVPIPAPIVTADSGASGSEAASNEDGPPTPLRHSKEVDQNATVREIQNRSTLSEFKNAERSTYTKSMRKTVQRKKSQKKQQSSHNREENVTPTISNILDNENRLDSPGRRINLSISTNERRGKIKVEPLEGSYDSPVKLRNEMEETFYDNRTEGASKIDQDQYTETQLSSSQAGMKSRLLTDDGKASPQLTARVKDNQSQFVPKPMKAKKPITDLGEISDAIMKAEQQLLQEEVEKQHLTQQVSTDFLDVDIGAKESVLVSLEQLLPTPAQTRQKQQMPAFSKNRLSIDPLVFPSHALQQVSTIATTTVEKEQADLQHTNFKKKSKGKKGRGRQVFAPANGVYDANQMLTNPELAKRDGIHFTVGVNAGVMATNGLNYNSLNAATSPTSSQQRSKKRKEKIDKLNLNLPKAGSVILNNPSSNVLPSTASINTAPQNDTSRIGRSQIDPGFGVKDFVNEQRGMTYENVLKQNGHQSSRQLMSNNFLKHQSSMMLVEQQSIHSSKRLDKASTPTTTEHKASKPTILSSPKQPQIMLRSNANGQVGGKPTSRILPDSLYQDLQHLSLPPLMSPTEKGFSPLMTPHMKKYLPVKDGFECSNHVHEKSLAQAIGLKQVQLDRNEARRKEKPRFVIKALDPTEYLSTTIAEVNHEDTARFRNRKRTSTIDVSMTPKPKQTFSNRNRSVMHRVGDSAHQGQSIGSQVDLHTASDTRPMGFDQSIDIEETFFSQEGTKRVKSYRGCENTISKREFRQKFRQSEAVKGVVQTMGIQDNKLIVFKGNLFPDIGRVISERSPKEKPQRGHSVR